MKLQKVSTPDYPYQEFIIHFGEMGRRWGLNRTVAQIFALIYVHEAPLNAESIAEILGVSRSNVSMALKELQSWQLISSFHQAGDRRDYFKAPDNVWDIAKIITKERQKRELMPTLKHLEDVVNADTASSESYAIRRLDEMRELLTLFVNWSDEFQKAPPSMLERFMRMGGSAFNMLNKFYPEKD